MANLPSTDSGISIHLSDRALTPLISSSFTAPGSHSSAQSQPQSQALSSLTTAAIAAYDSASRLGLGLPQRIMIETNSSGPVILHSYLNPQPIQAPNTRSELNGRGIVEQAREDLRPLSATTEESSEGPHGESEALVNGTEYGTDGATEVEEESSVQQPPLLIATVVAPSAAEAGEARRAAARLERTGREFQREWVREQEEQQRESVGDGDEG